MSPLFPAGTCNFYIYVLPFPVLFPSFANYRSNYKKIIADEVQKQINTWDDEKKFYLWEDLDLEDLINEDTQFYINDKDQVVVFFNKYELGAGAMGTPEFIIDVSK